MPLRTDSESLAAGLWDGCPGLALQCCLLKSHAEVLSVGNDEWLGVGKTRLGEGGFVVPGSHAVTGMAPSPLLGPRLRSASGELYRCFKEKCSGQALQSKQNYASF